MRLTRDKGSPEGDSRLVGIVPPPNLSATSELEQLFVAAYRRLHGRVLDHAERFLDKEDARDAVGDAMETLWRRWPSLTPDQRGDKWVFGVVHRCVFAKLRANRRLVSLEDAEPELDAMTAAAIPDLSGADSAADVLDAVLTAMPPRRREVLLLIREEGLSYAEAAEALGVSIGTINTHMRLANEDLRGAFTRGGFRIAAGQPTRLPSPKGGDTND